MADPFEHVQARRPRRAIRKSTRTAREHLERLDDFNRSSDVAPAATLLRVLDRWCREERLFGIVSVDLDAFGGTDGTRNGLTAERVLSASTARLRCAARGGLVAWLGADELAVACEAATVDELGAVADRIVQALAAAIDVGRGPVRIRSHVGAAFGRPGEPPEAVLAMAEAARDHARRTGRGTWHLARHTHVLTAA